MWSACTRMRRVKPCNQLCPTVHYNPAIKRQRLFQQKAKPVVSRPTIAGISNSRWWAPRKVQILPYWTSLWLRRPQSYRQSSPPRLWSRMRTRSYSRPASGHHPARDRCLLPSFWSRSLEVKSRKWMRLRCSSRRTWCTLQIARLLLTDLMVLQVG